MAAGIRNVAGIRPTIFWYSCITWLYTFCLFSIRRFTKPGSIVAGPLVPREQTAHVKPFWVSQSQPNTPRDQKSSSYSKQKNGDTGKQQDSEVYLSVHGHSSIVTAKINNAEQNEVRWIVWTLFDISLTWCNNRTGKLGAFYAQMKSCAGAHYSRTVRQILSF